MARGVVFPAFIACLLLAAGCGGEQSSAVCQDLRVVQDTVQEIRDIELEEGALEELDQSAAELRSSVAGVRENAGEDLGDEVDAFESSLVALREDLETVSAEGDISAESVNALAAPVSNAVDAFQALVEAAPDCDL